MFVLMQIFWEDEWWCRLEFKPRKLHRRIVVDALNDSKEAGKAFTAATITASVAKAAARSWKMEIQIADSWHAYAEAAVGAAADAGICIHRQRFASFPHGIIHGQGRGRLPRLLHVSLIAADEASA